MLIEHISVSRDSCFQECPTKYKFRYHLKTVSPEPEQFHFVYGKIVHKIIEHYTINRGNLAIQDVIKQVLSGEVELEPGTKAPPLNTEYKKRLFSNIGNFMKFSEKAGTSGEIEWKFKLDMDGEGRCMTGFIDRLIIKNDKFFIVDYKTTKVSPWRKDERTILKDLQLQCYCYVIMKEFKVPAENIQASLFYLEDYKFCPVKYSQKTLDEFPSVMLQKYKRIEQMEAETVHGNVGNHCTRCDYRKICPWLRNT